MCNIRFKNLEHENFYCENLPQTRYPDGYHKALIYLLGVSEVTRTHFKQIYNIEAGCIKPGCLYEEWTTGNDRKIIRLAFNLYTGWTPIVRAGHSEQEKLEECSRYSINELFLVRQQRQRFSGRHHTQWTGGAAYDYDDILFKNYNVLEEMENDNFYGRRPKRLPFHRR